MSFERTATTKETFNGKTHNQGNEIYHLEVPFKKKNHFLKVTQTIFAIRKRGRKKLNSSDKKRKNRIENRKHCQLLIQRIYFEIDCISRQSTDIYI